MEQPVIAKKEVTAHILKTFNLRADKRLGQNFLVDEQIVKQIIAAAELSAEDTVLEVGPGIGTLTQALAETGAQVVAVELDRRLLPVLAKTLAGYDNIEIINEDILQLDIRKAVPQENFKVVANLPYYITTPIIFNLLEQKLPMERLVAMVQKEVAERMVAKPGGKDYGALSVAIQYYTEPAIAFVVPPASFVPPPSVDSAVRRKMLSNALKNMGIDNEQAAAWLELAGIDGKRRGETLSLAEFAALTNTFAKISK